jgi:DNA-binding transcriptional ArsR family regulator
MSPLRLIVIFRDGERRPTRIVSSKTASIGKALSSPHRLEILELLAQSERTVDSPRKSGCLSPTPPNNAGSSAGIIVVLGVSNALTNYVAGRFTDRV